MPRTILLGQQYLLMVDSQYQVELLKGIIVQYRLAVERSDRGYLDD
jgi:hypothetical protein